MRALGEQFEPCMSTDNGLHQLRVCRARDISSVVAINPDRNARFLFSPRRP